MNSKLLAALLIFSASVNVVQAVEHSRAPAAESLTDAPAKVVKPANQLDGDVAISTRLIGPGENIVQIIDHTRSVICYGKMNVGGAATISCQKFK